MHDDPHKPPEEKLRPLAPKQARSAKTLTNLLEAAERLILKNGIRNVSVGDIAREAESSVGGFYARFPDKDALLMALSERMQTRLTEQLIGLMNPERWANATLCSIVQTCAKRIVEHTAERMRIQSAVLQSVAADPARWKQGIAFRQQLIEGMTAVLLTRRAEINHPRPELAARFAVQSTFSLMDQYALFRVLEDVPVLADDQLAEEIERLVLGYLRYSP